MRVSESMAVRSFLNNLNAARSKVFERNQQVATGKKVNRPSDAPSDSARLIGIRDDVSRINQYYRNISHARLLLGTTDSTLNNVTNLLTRVFERAGFALNGTLKQTDRDGIAAEIRQIQEEIVRISSTKVNGKYIFSGSQVNTEPLLFSAGSYQYQGDNQALMIEISPGESIQVNATGIETFAEPVTDVVNVLTTLISQLEASDLDGARDSLATIYAAGEAINASRVRIGTSMSRLDDAKTGLDDEFLQLMTRLSDLEDVDMAEAISGLVQAETGLQATLSVGSRLHQLNLFDLLG